MLVHNTSVLPVATVNSGFSLSGSVKDISKSKRGMATSYKLELSCPQKQLFHRPFEAGETNMHNKMVKFIELLYGK